MKLGTYTSNGTFVLGRKSAVTDDTFFKIVSDSNEDFVRAMAEVCKKYHPEWELVLTANSWVETNHPLSL